MRKLKNLIIIIITIFIGIKNVNALHSFDNTIKVYDYAQVLTEQEEINLKKEVNNYINKYNIDMVIVTVKYYMQIDTNQYIDDFYNINTFGNGSNKDGIIIAVDLKNNNDDVAIKTYGKAVNLYNNDEIELILNKINKEETYYDKLYSFINYSDKYINENYIAYKENNTSRSINLLSIMFVSAIIPTVVIFVGLLKNKTIKKAENANYYVKNNSVFINVKNDQFVTTNTKKTRINK